jgi:hypothetical protein
MFSKCGGNGGTILPGGAGGSIGCSRLGNVARIQG